MNKQRIIKITRGGLNLPIDVLSVRWNVRPNGIHHMQHKHDYGNVTPSSYNRLMRVMNAHDISINKHLTIPYNEDAGMQLCFDVRGKLERGYAWWID